MQLYYHPLYSDLILAERHRFPIQKYKLLKTEIENLGVSAIHFQKPKKVTVSQLALCHSQRYIDDFLNGTLGRAELCGLKFVQSRGD
nr:hypothetical protein [Pseudoalteromonas sp. TB13]